MRSTKPVQGEVWYTDLDPIEGSEQGGRRPVVVISGNTLNHNLPLVIACPLTTRQKSYPGRVELLPSKRNGLKQPSDVLTFHVRALSQSRLKKRVGTISEADIQQILQNLLYVLTL